MWYLDSNGYITDAAETNTATYNYKSDESAVLYVNATYLNSSGGTAGTLQGALVAIPELTEDNNGTSATVTSNYHLNLYYDSTLDQFVNTIGSTTVDKIGFAAPGRGGALGSQNIATQEIGFTTYRGNVFSSISSTSAVVNYATKISKARFTLSGGAGGSSGSGNSATVSLNEGDPYTIGGGYSLKVDSITAKISGAGSGAVTGTDLLEASVKDAAVVTPLMTDTNPLVVLDNSPEASSTQNLIVVGGQMVNTVAQAAGVNLASGSQPEVKVYGGSKLVVAGYTAADTTEAGNALIKWLNDNRDRVRV